jgi:hypothetical protein
MLQSVVLHPITIEILQRSVKLLFKYLIQCTEFKDNQEFRGYEAVLLHLYLNALAMETHYLLQLHLHKLVLLESQVDGSFWASFHPDPDPIYLLD